MSFVVICMLNNLLGWTICKIRSKICKIGKKQSLSSSIIFPIFHFTRLPATLFAIECVNLHLITKGKEKFELFLISQISSSSWFFLFQRKLNWLMILYKFPSLP